MPPDYTAARNWFEQALAQDSAFAPFNLGVVYLNGLGVTQNLAAAREHFESAAANMQACEAATECYRTDADQGDAQAQHAMGYLYHHGIGVAQNNATAREWYEKASDQGHCLAQASLEGLEAVGEAAASEEHNLPDGLSASNSSKSKSKSDKKRKKRGGKKR